MTLEGGSIAWELSQAGRYNIVEEYRNGPHRDLIAADNDENLRMFVRNWGPLRGLDGSNRDSLAWYRDARDVLAAIVGLVAAMENRSEQRPALLELIRLIDFPFNPMATFLDMTRGPEGLRDDPKGWCENFTAKQVEDLCVRFLTNSLSFAARVLWSKRWVISMSSMRPCSSTT